MTHFYRKVALGIIGFTLLLIGAVWFLQHHIFDWVIHDNWERVALRHIQNWDSCSNQEQIVQQLRQKEFTTFYRIALISPEGGVLYDSHISDQAILSKLQILRYPEVIQALDHGSGYSDDYSQLLDRKLAYYAYRFDYTFSTGLTTKYILRIAFPLEDILELQALYMKWLETALILTTIIATAGVLFIVYRFSAPIRVIMQAIKPYYLGLQDELPYVLVSQVSGTDEMEQLALTINQLSLKIKQQIQQVIAQKNEKEAIVDSLSEGIITISSDNEIQYCNAAALNMLNKLKHELIGKNFQLLGEVECSRLIQRTMQLQTTQTQLVYMQGLGYNSRFFNLCAVPLPDKQGIVLVMSDRTEHYRILQIHKEFIANASHELKTPITIIKGFSETLSHLVDLQVDKVKPMAHKILKHANRLNELIDSLLTLSQIENRTLVDPTDCDPILICQQCADILQVQYPTAQIHCTPLDPPIYIKGEAKLLETALSNVIENGIKYSIEPALIEISASFDQNSHIYILQIKDHGIGISDQDIGHIFERFYRVDASRNRSTGGNGLGLSIVKTIISQHGGIIEVFSIPGHGTTFTIKFKL